MIGIYIHTGVNDPFSFGILGQLRIVVAVYTVCVYNNSSIVHIPCPLNVDKMIGVNLVRQYLKWII